ncbi:hypothetical protein IF1G_11064 [Cordyceps javanica]|uniref:BZIP transcription factor domain-containing protein n=1 Tax=Cordyceps javanica TaxID=43265 RepID=A0A545ULG3_9HYPO|nr:hypothetical protein IF1G_11064 [Cordyceps javanica]TQW01769.1 mnd1 family domain-containing protein [Cordyceps javanica]
MLSKRRASCRVSTLTPSQLARKRAKDREAQRAQRARTKEHIERLECELEELRSHQNRDRAVQDLLRRNKALEDELNRLRQSMGMFMTSFPQSAPAVYDGDAVYTSGATIPSPLATSDDNNLPTDYGHSGLRLFVNNVDTFTAFAASHIHYNADSSSPSADDFAPDDIAFSVPTNLMPASNGLPSRGYFPNWQQHQQGSPRELAAGQLQFATTDRGDVCSLTQLSHAAHHRG